ncbi:phosphate ABC transporter ATP-binding protein [Desulforhabdus amnigena]|jgi:phosphate transport system ATP-binding protein|uniref:Phosphate ABC transporter ATP-binding protein n=1 Tax=Desulforhabdus amnigena TaxID=40218 RepID=A0A9W6D3T9_9BACT|nr:ATP-binding cassette domain-containing protein [Desulforhabdus amnigena]NLJ29103.1 ATP-binding cassette domain-containing protein [Deltaproteobacteria bacterium]GLI32576.1 phosphate ABC transporter ATP-binding protein [Desulforhabdus amnigena]
MEEKIVEPVIAIERLSVHFAAKVVLKDVSLSVFPGELIIIVGHSGSGKSTLLRAINRLNECSPDCCTKGTIRVRFDGMSGDIYAGSISPNELRRRVGMVFQTPAILPFSIEKNITMPLKVTLGLRGQALSEHTEWALREASLWDEVKERLRDDASTLSGGQQQRLCLARTLALQPQALLLDEPTASLDFRAANRIEQLLLRLKKHYCIVAVSHSLGQAKRLADRLFILREGRIAQEMDRQALQDETMFRRLIEEAF